MTPGRILSFLHRTLRPTVLDLSIPLHPSMETMDDVVFLAHVHPDDDGELYSAFYAVAGEYRDRYSFVVVPAEERARGSVVRCVRNLVGVEGGRGEGQRVGVMRGDGEGNLEGEGEVERGLRGFVERGCAGEGVVKVGKVGKGAEDGEEVVKVVNHGEGVEEKGEGGRGHEEL